MLVRIVVAILLSLIAIFPARSEERGCYWNAPGLPYSMEPPYGLGEKLSGNPLEVTFAMLMNAPGLVAKWGCGVIGDEDVADARGIYQRWGCTSHSSLGLMIEGLADGGVLVSEVMTVFPILFEEHRDELAAHCAFVATVPPQCFRGVPIEGENVDENIMRMNRKYARERPECTDKWPRFKEFEDTLIRTLHGYPGVADLARRDRALLESAGVQ